MPDQFSTAASVRHELDPLELSNLTWELLSKTNPSKPHVSVPTFVGELKDLPLLFKSWGDDLLRQHATGYITAKWAIAPLMSDIMKMLDFSKAINDRLTSVKRARDGKPIKRMASLGGETKFWNTETQLLNSSPVGLTGHKECSSEWKLWGTVQYVHDSSYPFPEDISRDIYHARQLALGITGWETLATTWELLPWSWFVDWFAGVGTTISALHNSLHLVPTMISIMYYRKLTLRSKVTGKADWVTIDVDPIRTSSIKERHPGVRLLPFPVYMPLFDSGKWTILSALAVLSSRYGRKSPRMPKWNKHFGLFD
jgi:hypothetical protein